MLITTIRSAHSAGCHAIGYPARIKVSFSGTSVDKVLAAVQHRRRNFVKHLVGDPLALKYALVPVEGPMDAQVDPTFGVLKRCRTETGERTRRQRANPAVFVPCDPIELVGSNGERYLIR